MKKMRIVVIGNGMVGHKFLEALSGSAEFAQMDVIVLAEEPRPAYDRVYLSSYFSGKTAADLSLVKGDFFDEQGIALRLNTCAIAIDRQAKTAPLKILRPSRLVLACPRAVWWSVVACWAWKPPRPCAIWVWKPTWSNLPRA